MKLQDSLKLAQELGFNIEHKATNAMIERFYDVCFEAGRQAGIRQERALVELAKTSHEIEKMDDECPVCHLDQMFLVGTGAYWKCGTCNHFEKPVREEP